MLKNTLTLIVSSLLLTACSIFSPIKATNSNQYVLNTTPQIISEKTPAKPITLLIALPQASPIYNTTQMAYINKPYQIAYFAENRWADTPPRMLQNLIVQTLQNTHTYHAIVATPFNGHYDQILNTELVQLQQNFLTKPSQIQLVLRTQLINAANNQIIATKQFSITETAPQDNPEGGVIAANRAAAKVLQKLTGFLLSN